MLLNFDAIKFYFKYKSINIGYILLKTLCIIISIIPSIILIIFQLVVTPILFVEAILVGLANLQAGVPDERLPGGPVYLVTWLINFVLLGFLIIGCLPDRNPSIFSKF